MTSAAQLSFYDYTDDRAAQRHGALVTSLTVMMSLSLGVGLADSISSALFGTAAHADLVEVGM